MNFKFIVICVLSVFCCHIRPSTNTCTDTGHVFDIGDTWVDAEACDACECFSYGQHCYARLDDGKCKLNSTVVSPFDRICRYNMQLYLVGQTFRAVDGCNICSCLSDGLNCTINSCKASGFAYPSKTPLYGECMYGAAWFPLHSQWLSRDGCNTCFCYTVGNYRGGHVCTKNKCQTLIPAIAG